MKTNLLLIIAAYFISIGYATAQLTAGEIPIGRTTSNPNINLTTSTTTTGVSGTIDLDCDGTMDLNVYLYKGKTSTDGPSYVYFKLKNSQYEICIDTVQYQIRTYFQFGDTLKPVGSHKWSTDTMIYIGDYGGFLIFGPSKITDEYIAFRQKTGTKTLGWIKITFNIEDGGNDTKPITLSITEILRVCLPSTIKQISPNMKFEVTPNPSTDGNLCLKYKAQLKRLELVNTLGQSSFLSNDSYRITLPNEKGLYIIRAWDVNDNYSQSKVIRQ
ncbi:MAG: hypothetical protein JNL63_03965 [Bacteroidia bacterium]|nr:hypothetical protein [Bacteroidia bacterium]